MAKSKRRSHGSGKKPAPRMTKFELRDSLAEKLTAAEIEELYRQIHNAVESAVKEAMARTEEQAYVRHWAVTMRVLKDRFGWGHGRLKRWWDACLDYLKDVSDGRMTLQEMLDCLEHEDDIHISWTTEWEEESK